MDKDPINNNKTKGVLRQPGLAWLGAIVLAGIVVFGFQSIGLSSHLQLLQEKAAWDNALQERGQIAKEIQTLRDKKTEEDKRRTEAETLRLDAERQLGDTSNALVAVKLQVDSATRQMAEAIDKYNKAELSRDKAVAEESAARKSQATVQALENELRQKVASLEAQLVDLGTKQNLYMNLTNRFVAIQGKQTVMLGEIDKAQQQLVTTLTQLADAGSDYRKVQDLIRRKAPLEQEVAALTISNSVLALSIDAGKKELLGLKQEIAGLGNPQAELARIRTELPDRSKELQDLLKKIEGLSAKAGEMEHLQQTRDQLLGSIVTLKRDEDALKKSEAEWTEKISSLRAKTKQYSEVIGEMSASRSEVSNLFIHAASLRGECSQITTELETTKAQLKTLTDKKVKLEGAVNDLETQVEKLRKISQQSSVKKGGGS